MKDEIAALQWLREQAKRQEVPITFTRLENQISPGLPDLHCMSWNFDFLMELKMLKGDGSGIYYQKNQIAWICAAKHKYNISIPTLSFSSSKIVLSTLDKDTLLVPSGDRKLFVSIAETGIYEWSKKNFTGISLIEEIKKVYTL